MAFQVASQVPERARDQIGIDRTVNKVATERVTVSRAAHQRRCSVHHDRVPTGAADRDFVTVDRAGIDAVTDVGEGNLQITLCIQ